MPFATAFVATDQPARHAEQLVAGLGQQQQPATRRSADGRTVVEFSDGGGCVIAPHGRDLELIALARDAQGLATVQRTVESLLIRLGGPAQQLRVEWSVPATADGTFEPVDPAVADYALAHSTAPDEVLSELAVETREALGGRSGMQVSHDEGALLTMLVRLVGAKNAVEVGTFTGYSSVCIARGLAEGGRLLACDVSEEWTAIARAYWDKAGVADRIDLKIAPAVETLQALPRDEALFDFAFIDADKDAYPVYYEEVVTRLRPGGVIVLDNVLRGGRVVDPAYEQFHEIPTMRRLNEQVAADERVDAVLLPLRDGVTVIRKR